MIYQAALEHEIYEMRNAEKIHPEFDYEKLQEFIKEKYNLIILFSKRLKDPEIKSIETV